MSISSEVVKVTEQGDDVTTTFAVPFTPVASNTEIKVYIRDETDPSSPVEELQVISTDYTLTGSPFATSVIFNTAPTSDQKVIIKSGLANTQPTDIDGNKSISENALEKSLDRACRQIQQIAEQLTRVPKLPVTEQQSENSMALPEGALNPDTVLGYDASGNLEAKTLSDLDVSTELASQAEAEAGVENSHYMSPLRTEQHYDSKRASQAEAEAGVNNENHMSPLRVSQAIDALGIPLDTMTTKGDLITFHTADSQRLAVGSDYQRLCALAAETSGLKWLSNYLAYLASSTTPLTGTALHDVVNIDATAGAKTYNPDATTSKVLKIRKSDSSVNAVTITGVTILHTQGESVEIIYSGAAWVILSRYIPAITASLTMTGSWVTNTTYICQGQRLGDVLSMRATVVVAGGVGTPGALTLTIPNSLVIDTAKLSSTNTSGGIVGHGVYFDSGSANYDCEVIYNSTTSVNVRYLDDAAAGVATNAVTHTAPVTPAAGDEVNCIFSVPIVGWNG